MFFTESCQNGRFIDIICNDLSAYFTRTTLCYRDIQYRSSRNVSVRLSVCYKPVLLVAVEQLNVSS